MSKNKFSFGEDSVLNNIGPAIEKVKQSLNVKEFEDNSMNASSQINSNENIGMVNQNSRVRVLSDTGLMPVQSVNNSFDEKVDNVFNKLRDNSSNSDFSNGNMSGSSFVMVVIAVILLIFVVSVVTFGMLKMFGM